MTIAINTYNAWTNYINRDPKHDKDFFASDSWKIAKSVLEMRKNV